MPGIWELRVKRLGLQSKAGEPTRTYGSYQVVIDGVAQGTELSGHICERIGPGDNSTDGVHDHVRIEEGRYAQSTQFGDHYKSIGFGTKPEFPMPGFLLLGTEHRTAILVHPGHPPTLYLSSIGCFNPTKPLKASDKMDFTDSRTRVVALLDSLKAHDPAAFSHNGVNTKIADAFIVIEGEPMTPVSDADALVA